MSLPFKNLYHSRKVAETASRACSICYKPTATVLVASDGVSDFFYVCDSHLKDKGFATGQLDPVEEAARRKKLALAKEMELVEQKWKEREKAKKDSKEDSKDSKDKDTKSKDKDTKPKDKKKKEESNETTDEAPEPRIFVLNKDIYNIRVSAWRDKQRSKRTAELLAKPSLFPKVPTHSPEPESSKQSPS
ncbi:hypothetical protein TRVA0_019S00826 [Trichomonascus vanleenenianus]|uniref:AAA-ATPase Vps4-associated 1 family protein n=1 Tax=Trichomonascus vanleenenianus TaxID=2268995 RepID=UPI003ECA1004